MKKFFNLVLFIFCFSKAFSQNNPIFQGGVADGIDKIVISQALNNINTGGIGGGSFISNFNQPSNNIFIGNSGDGQSTISFLQAVNNIFSGGQADGWANSLYLQTANGIFAGGNGDGWNNTTILQAGNSIFAGGNGDGWNAMYYKPNVALPVKLQLFTAKKIDDYSAEISWKTSNEINSSHFEIERGSDALHFEYLAKEIAIGNTSETIEYNFIDNNPSKGINYYRLKMVDLNGKYEYSPARALNFAEMNKEFVKYYPNPSQGILNIELDITQQSTNKIINIINSIGLVIEHFQIEKSKESKFVIDLNRLPKGIYFINLITGNINNTQKIILN